jgi:NADPH:quinone reductase-like Zn-dependent oxidoreductase
LSAAWPARKRAGGFSPGDEVIGFSNNRASQAELVPVEAGDLTRKPEKVSV